MRKIMRAGLALMLAAALSMPMLAQSQAPRGGRYDQQIEREVTRRLSSKDKLKNVRATVEDGIVTLQGTVDLYMYKEDAERAARKVEHVAGVRDMIAVGGNPIPDGQLRDMLADKLRYDRISQGIVFNALTVGVKNGVATVGGNVRDYADKASALAIVAKTPGVRDVVDQIEVAPVSIYDDDLRVAIARAIYGHPVLQRYAVDPQAPIRIVVERGRVTLYGVVDSAQDRQIAEMRAREVPNVFAVTNRLMVASEGDK